MHPIGNAFGRSSPSVELKRLAVSNWQNINNYVHILVQALYSISIYGGLVGPNVLFIFTGGMFFPPTSRLGAGLYSISIYGGLVGPNVLFIFTGGMFFLATSRLGAGLYSISIYRGLVGPNVLFYFYRRHVFPGNISSWCRPLFYQYLRWTGWT